MIRSPGISELTKATLYRLEKTLDLENEDLSRFNGRNLPEYSRVKAQTLLELQRSAALFSNTHPTPEFTKFLESLRKKLELNRWLLFLHLEAAREITSVITSAMRESESDGTYSGIGSPPRVNS